MSHFDTEQELNQIHRELTTEYYRLNELATAMEKANRPYTCQILTEISKNILGLLNRIEDAWIALPVQDDF